MISFAELNDCIIHCHKCPRLVDFRENVPEKKQFADHPYWKKPVPGFGDPKAKLMILGLAPSAQGGNRTGRIFTGDASARFLFQALFAEGLANQPTSESLDDGLLLKGCYITAAVKCAPPKDKPNAAEQKSCFPYLTSELRLLPSVEAVLVLGQFAFGTYLSYANTLLSTPIRPRFSHGSAQTMDGLPTLYCSYHPSPQNTNTGKLSLAMMRAVLQQIKANHFGYTGTG
ncbi:MAG: uracil-DNA glycosylase [Chlamydiota bacterium]